MKVSPRTNPVPQPIIYLGIDGEGIDIQTPEGEKHVYVFLAACNEAGTRAYSIENRKGLSTKSCLDFLLALPKHNHRAYGYALNYDWTKILTDLPNKSLYKLFRPELRQRYGKDAIKGPKPILWEGYWLNLQGTKFTIRKDNRRIVIWDIFKFYGSKFVSALKDWQIGNKDLHKRMEEMKNQRGAFKNLSAASVRDYCLEECACMAQLARKLVDAHDTIGLPLRSFYGAGSSASAMLSVMGIRDKVRAPSSEMLDAVSRAFFGGRFENSVIGSVREEVWNYDISSAYPYQLYFLPCLVHGTWSRITRRSQLDKYSVGLVHYGLGVSPRTNRAWAPFPFRTADGSICFPEESGGGWVYLAEYLAGEKIFPHVKFKEAWVYKTECDCHPFKQIGQYYLERIRIGKEGPGIVIKLAVNSCYGKLAQSIGNALFNCWIWAGMITSGTRAQILECMGLLSDFGNMLMVATDGFKTRERIECPKPLDTGTGFLLNGGVNPKPLGGWEEKREPKGVFCARPGIYFPLDPTENEIKDVRGRGVGKGVVLNHHRQIVEGWNKTGLNGTVKVTNVKRFCGAKTSISRSGVPGHFLYNRASGENGENSPSYGQWVNREVELGFNPLPKREGVNDDGLTLTLRHLGRDLASVPYDRVTARQSPESLLLQAATVELLEQPDADYQEAEEWSLEGA